MITEITYEEIPRTIYKRGFVLTFPPGTSQDLYFRVDEDLSPLLEKYDSIGDYIAEKHRQGVPRAINLVKAIDKEGKYIIVAYNKKEISKADVLDFLRLLFT